MWSNYVFINESHQLQASFYFSKTLLVIQILLCIFKIFFVENNFMSDFLSITWPPDVNEMNGDSNNYYYYFEFKFITEKLVGGFSSWQIGLKCQFM